MPLTRRRANQASQQGVTRHNVSGLDEGCLLLPARKIEFICLSLPDLPDLPDF
jgi:hypothetical protein